MGRRLGAADGIHAGRIGAFTPSAEAVRWARAVAAAFAADENAGKGVLKVEGRMVERLHLAEAERLIAISEAIAALQG